MLCSPKTKEGEVKIKLDRLDMLFSEFIRRRAFLFVHGCEYCGKPVESYKKLQCSHFHGRRKRSTRYDPDNACGLCFSCHIYLGENPYTHTEFFKKRLGSERFELLNIRADKVSKIDKDAIKLYLKGKIEEIAEILR